MAMSKEATESEAMVGVLLDLSGSMKEMISENMHSGVKDTRAHAMINALTEIIKKESENSKNSMLFTVAFGIDYGNVNTLDLLSAGDLFKDGGRADRYTCQQILKELECNGAWHIFNYIQDGDLCNQLSQKLAQTLLDIMRRRTDLTQQFAKTLPEMVQTPSFSSFVKNPLGFVGKAGFNAVQGNVVTIKKPTTQEIAAHVEDAKVIFRQEIDAQMKREIEEMLDNNENPTPRRMSEISRDLNPGTTSSKLHDCLDKLEPYIYGGTPMCAALTSALTVFKNSFQTRKIFHTQENYFADEQLLFARCNSKLW